MSTDGAATFVTSAPEPRWARALTFALALLAGVTALTSPGCDLDTLEAPPPCDVGRRLSGGACCPVWTRAVGGAACEPQSFKLPSLDDGVGDIGAKTLELAVDARGLGVAAWAGAQVAGAGAGVRVSVAEEQPGGAWTVRAPSAALAGSSSMVDVAAEPDGAVLVAWKQLVGESGSIFVSRRGAGGAWADPLGMEARFSFEPTAYEPRLAIHPSGEVLLVWNQYMSTGYGVALARRAPGSATWELPSNADDVLSPKLFFSNGPQIAVGAAGDALVTWYQSGEKELMVRASERRGPSGAFTHPSIDDAISPPGGPADSHPIANPTPAVGPHGEAAIVWTQENGDGANPVFIATRDESGAWTRPTSVGDAFSRPYGTARCARAVFDPKGWLYVTWYQNEGLGERAYVAKRAPSGEWIDGGRAPFLLSSPSWEGQTPALAVDEAGAVLAVWVESSGGSWRIGARRTGPDLGWGPIEILSPEAPGVVTGLDVAIGGPTSRAIVGWTFGEAAKERAYFATID